MTFLRLFFRNLRRQKLFSFINILGLTTGFLCTILIYLYVENELSYDQFHTNGERLYRVNQTFIWGEDNTNLFASTGPGVGNAIVEDIPDVDEVVRVHTAQLMPVRFEEDEQEKFFHDETLFAVDSNFFQVFSFQLKYGDQSSALKQPYSVVLTEETSKRFFGDEDPIGKLVDMGGGENRKSFKVTGVVAETEENSYLDFDMLISMNSIERVKRHNWSWMWTTFETFVLLNEGAIAEEVQQKLNKLPAKHAVRTLQIMGYTYEEYIEAGKEWNLYLQPFQDIHLYSNNVINRLNATGNHKVVTALAGSAIFIIVLCCINFINLSTSQFTAKAKSFALRKVLGSSKAALRKIHLGEAFMFCVLSVALSVLLAAYILPFFNKMVGLELSFEPFQNPIFLLFIVAVVLTVSVVAGLYPALFFSAFKPMTAMRGELKSGKSGARLRNGMLVVQYVLSLLLIICSGVVYQQLQHVFNADLGYTKENLVTIENVQWTGASEEFAYELKQISGVKTSSLCDATPLFVSNGDQFRPDKPDGGSVPLNYVLADEEYISLLGLELLVGRGFDASYSDDEKAIVVNESALRSIGWPADESVLNKKISGWGNDYHIVGVVKDFYYWGLITIEPFAIFHPKSTANFGRPLSVIALSVTAASSDELKATLAEVKSKWEEFVPNRPFEYLLIEQEFRATYESEERFGNVLTWFTVLTLIIAGLGLLGMVIYSIEQKTKEIGIRKVLGASILNITTLFGKTYVKLLCVAIIIATPIGYYFMDQWLNDFNYRISISPMVFIGAGLAVLLISVMITSYHSIRASLINPAEVLKDE